MNKYDYITKKEWNEILGLEYVLTWGYSDHIERDEKRYDELREKLYGKDWERFGKFKLFLTTKTKQKK